MKNYAFKRKSDAQLAVDAARERGAAPVHSAKHARLPKRGVSHRITIQFPEDGIEAMEGYRPGKAECKVLVLVAVGSGFEFKDSGRTEDVYNWSADIIGDTGYRIGKAEFEDGVWQVAAADCEDEREFVAAGAI